MPRREKAIEIRAEITELYSQYNALCSAAGVHQGGWRSTRQDSMIYRPNISNALVVVTYGSHLYGTSTSTSDHDFKVVTLPSYRDLVLNKTLNVQRFRFTADGEPIGEGVTMPPGGYEAEHIPVQKFVHDYLGGQAYAVELVFAVMQSAFVPHLEGLSEAEVDRTVRFGALCIELGTKFLHQNVQGMVGFAMKQTFDYVRRGERLNAAKAAYDVLDASYKFHTADKNATVRLDLPLVYADGFGNLVQEKLIHHIARHAKLELGSSMNGGREMLTLKLNGREYLETTALPHLMEAVNKLITQYGERSTGAAETKVEWKSLSHAVRVYQQVLELLKFGAISFPRANADTLLSIKKGKRSLESVKELLRDLDSSVEEALKVSALPKVTDKFRAEVEQVLFEYLNQELALVPLV